MAEALLAGQRCLVHPEREAAARCPECRRAYCRECVTEHDGRMLCASCIARLALPADRRERVGRRRLRRVAARLPGAGRVAGGVLAAWLFFQALGESLAMIPAATHAGGDSMDARADGAGAAAGDGE